MTSTTTDLSPVPRLLAGFVSALLMLQPALVRGAEPAAEPPTAEESADPRPDSTEPADASDAKAQVRAALEAGDLTRARDLAVRAREEDPDNPELWALEVQVHERRGDLAAAKEALRRQLALLPPAPDEARAAAQADLDRLENASRGTQPGEPTSTHREELDARRGPPPPKTAAAPTPSEPAPPPRERLVKKWYFWVTLGAIVASAAAITGIAIKAAVSKREDALDAQALTPSPNTRTGALLRF